MKDQSISQLTQIESECVERMGLVLQREGLPRIAGKIWGVLIMRDDPFSFSDLATLLQVSRASISTNTRLLEDLSVIERVGVQGEREDFFRLRKRPYEALMKALQSRMDDAITMCKDTLSCMVETDAKGACNGAQKRVEELCEFYGELHHLAEEMLNKDKNQ